MDEDEIDTEALQAQIDLSMSFAQNLVSEWVKPSRKLSNRTRDVEGELKEYMRRPPRLGVGAPIPETQSFARETARLKGQLKGPKRSREDEDVRKDKSESSEEESRAGAIKKKARLDPFGDGNGKKKRKKQAAHNDSAIHSPSMPPPLSVPGPTDIEQSEQAEVMGMITEADATELQVMAVPSPLPSIHGPFAKQSADQVQTLPSTLIPTSSRSIEQDSQNAPEKLPAANFLLRSPNVPLIVDIPLAPTPVLPSSHRSLMCQSVEMLQQPILNLHPLSSGDDSDQGVDLAASSPRKKKKRRKRKKRHSRLPDVTTTAKSNGDV